MIRRPPRSTRVRSSAASDVYKRQDGNKTLVQRGKIQIPAPRDGFRRRRPPAVSYTHLRAHETPEHPVCRLLLETKKGGGSDPVHTRTSGASAGGTPSIRARTPHRSRRA